MAIRSSSAGSIRCSIFSEPDLDQVKETHRVDAQGVELSADGYVSARGDEAKRKELQRISDAARLASKFGLDVAIGHGLSTRNLHPLLDIQGLHRINVGYSLIARAFVVGFERAVNEAFEIVSRSPVSPR